MGEKRKKLIQWVGFFACIAIITGILIAGSLSKIKREGTAYYEDDMITIVQNHAKKINNDLEKLKVSGETAAHMLSAKDTPEEKDIADAALAILYGTDASRVIYHGGSGAGYEWDGESLVEKDITQFSFYDILSGTKEATFTFAESLTDSGSKDAVVLICPIESETDQHLLIFYPMEQINDSLRITTEFDPGSFAVLVDLDGNIITKSDYESNFLEAENLLDGVSRKYQNEIVRAKIQMLNRTYGCFEAVSVDGGENKTIVFAPLKMNEWSVVAGVNQTFVNKREKSYWNSSAVMIYQIVGVFFFFIVMYFIFSYVGKRKNDEKDRKLREKADTDLLTGLTNKLATERLIKEYIAQYPDSLAMMFVLDIDNFKKINDTMGHAFGDEVLKTLGRTISPIFRVTDIVGRTGGDEFTIFLKFLKSDENTLKEAQKLVKFFRDFTAGEYVKYSATASIGAAVFPADGKDFDSLYKAADKALYKAKQRGKNQLAFYDDRDRAGNEETNQ